MRRWDPENVLQVECAQLGREKERHEQEHVEPTFETRCWPPIVRNPIVRTELTNDTFELATDRGNIPETTPVVRLHGKVLACFHAQVDAQAIANNHIEKPLKKKKNENLKKLNDFKSWMIRVGLRDPTSIH